MKSQLFSSLSGITLKRLEGNATHSPLRYIVMAKKFIISFFLSISILIVSEYFFLQEMYGQQRAIIILLTATGIITSILSFWFFFKKYSRTTK
jgi:hypothetical protein